VRPARGKSGLRQEREGAGAALEGRGRTDGWQGVQRTALGGSRRTVAGGGAHEAGAMGRGASAQGLTGEGGAVTRQAWAHGGLGNAPGGGAATRDPRAEGARGRQRPWWQRAATAALVHGTKARGEDGARHRGKSATAVIALGARRAGTRGGG
jgi:hypothetical protein